MAVQDPNDFIANNFARAVNAGESQSLAAVDAARQGLGVANAAAGAMRNDANNMRSQARLVNTQGAQVNASADELAALVPQLTPYAQRLGDYGDRLASLSTSLTEKANDVFGQGAALVNMDQSAGGLAAEFMRYFRSLSPDNLVSRAASDAQAASQNQLAQAERNLSRRGVSASSGAFGALRKTAANAAAALLAKAKTQAYSLGLDKQGAQLDKMVSAAATLYGLGDQTQGQATQALGAAGDMQKGAAGVVGQQGSMLSNVGSLRATAGSLFSNAASIFGSAAGVEGGAANLGISALNNLQSALSKASAYYSGVAGLVAAGGRGGGGSVDTNTGRHYDVGGELLETGSAPVDAQLQMWRDKLADKSLANKPLADKPKEK